MKAVSVIRAPQYGKPIQLWEKWGTMYAEMNAIRLPPFLRSTELYKKQKFIARQRMTTRTIENNYVYDLYVYLKDRKPRSFSRIN